MEQVETVREQGLVSLPMYDLPELRQQTTALLQGVAEHLGALGLEGRLTQPGDLAAHWREPELLLSQTCGYPLLSLPPRVQVVATPAYTAPGCDGASYRSALIVHRNNRAADLAALRGGVCAINGWDSNSGMNLLRAAVAPLAGGSAFFGRIAVTGSHAASIEAVGSTHADLAAIDCVTLALLQRHRPALTRSVRVLGWTMSAPGLPLITAGGAGRCDLLRQALAAVVSDPAFDAVRQTLLIDRFVVLAADAYAAIRLLEDEASAGGYPVLA